MKYNAIILILSFLAACNSPRYLAKPSQFKNHIKGMAIEIKKGRGQDFYLKGEIIEVTAEDLKVLPYVNASKVRVIPRATLKMADIIVATTSDNPTGISTWAALINLAVIGHGWFAGLTLPINVISTSIIGSTAAKSTYRIKYPEGISWEELHKFARFPQGLPEHIDPAEIW